MSHCTQYSAITRDYLYSTSYELMYRDGWTGSSPQIGSHSSRIPMHFNSAFFNECSEIARQINSRSPKTLNWVGNVGVGFCKPGYHGSARAFDLTHVRYTDGTYIDTNRSWRYTATQQRWYVGLAAQCRLICSTVLTAWYNAEHQDHIHFDNGAGDIDTIVSGWRSDTVLVQAICNILSGESLSIDGAWGPLTDAAYGRLIVKLGMSCMNPRTNAADGRGFWAMIAQTGLRGQLAGTYFYPC
jgi:hypothetical protein